MSTCFESQSITRQLASKFTIPWRNPILTYSRHKLWVAFLLYYENCCYFFLIYSFKVTFLMHNIYYSIDSCYRSVFSLLISNYLTKCVEKTSSLKFERYWQIEYDLCPNFGSYLDTLQKRLIKEEKNVKMLIWDS